MKKRVVWKLLDSLSSAEQAYFLEWLKTELHHTQHFVQELASILVGIYPDPLTPEEIWPRLYPDHPYDYARFRKLSSDLSSRLETFVSWLAFKEDSVQSKVQVLRYYNQRNQLELFEKQYRKVKKELENQPIRNAVYFRTLYEVETEYQRMKLKEGKKDLPELLESISFSLDSWWLHDKLPLSLKINIREMQGFHPINHFLPINILEEIRSIPTFYNQSLIRIYIDAHRLISTSEIPDIPSMLAFLSEERSHLTEIEILSLFYLLQNSLVRRINKSIDGQSIEQLQTLFEWGIQTKIIFQDGHLPWRSLFNIIAVHLNLSLIEIARLYHKRYIGYVSDKDKVETSRFLNGLIAIFDKDFKKAGIIFNEQKFTLSFFEISARSFLLQINYELENSEPDWLIGQAEAFSKFIKNKKVRNTLIEFHLGFTKNFIKLNRAYTREDLLSLKDQIQSTPNSHKKKWLEEKIQQKLN